MRFTLSTRSITIASAVVILATALATRLYSLGSFPYFPPLVPWNGAQTTQASLQGLYVDEYTYLYRALPLLNFPPHFSLYQPPLALSFLDLSVLIFGTNAFAVRLPFAIFSSLTAVFVFLIARRLSKSTAWSFISALFYVAMVPALIYGRMAFIDNASAFFFVGMFYLLLRYKDEQVVRTRNYWLLAASFFAGFSVLSKITGLVSVVFFLLFLYKAKTLRRSVPYIIPVLAIVAIFPVIVLYYVGFSPVSLTSQLTQEYNTFLVGNEIGVWRYFFLATFPSGFTTWWGGPLGFPKPEFWYIILYVTLAAVAIKEFPTYSDLILAVTVFVAFISVIAPLGSYYLIFVQPLLAVPFGAGIRRLLHMPVQAALGVYAFLYVPLAISLGFNTVTGMGAGNPFLSDPILFLWKFLLVIIPLAALLLSFARYEEDRRWRTGYNAVLIVMLLAVLFAASYLAADLYPQYFFQSAFTP